MHRGNVAYYVGDLVDRLHDRFTQQIGRALRHEAGATDDCDNDQDYEALGQAKTMLFLERLPEIRKILATDVQAAYDGDPACKSLDEVIFCYPGLEAITIYRLAHVLYELDIPFIPRMMTEWAHSRTGIDIHPGAHIGSHFFIDHGTGVVIGETSIIGSHVKLYQGVSLIDTTTPSYNPANGRGGIYTFSADGSSSNSTLPGRPYTESSTEISELVLAPRNLSARA